MINQTALPQRAPSEVCWEDIPDDDHSVQIYSDRQVLLDALEGFVTGGLRAGESVIVIATASHRRALDNMLKRRGYDLERVMLENRYITIDAETALDQFMVAGWPDEGRFNAMMEGLLGKARMSGHQVRAFGEMVMLLWSRGDRGATLQLEQLWNAICARERFRLFCAYPSSCFSQDAHDARHTVCAHHSRVIPE